MFDQIIGYVDKEWHGIDPPDLDEEDDLPEGLIYYDADELETPACKHLAQILAKLGIRRERR